MLSKNVLRSLNTDRQNKLFRIAQLQTKVRGIQAEVDEIDKLIADNTEPVKA